MIAWNMQDLQVERTVNGETFTLHRPDRLSSIFVALFLLVVPMRWDRILRAESLRDALHTAFGALFVVTGLLVGLLVYWRWARHDIIRVSDRLIVLERRLGPAMLNGSVEIDRQRLTEVVIRETEIKTRGHPYLQRSLIFFDGNMELGRTLQLSPETARQLAEASLAWPSLGPESTG